MYKGRDIAIDGQASRIQEYHDAFKGGPIFSARFDIVIYKSFIIMPAVHFMLMDPLVRYYLHQAASTAA